MGSLSQVSREAGQASENMWAGSLGGLICKALENGKCGHKEEREGWNE